MSKTEGEVAMNRLRICFVFFAFVVVAARADETNTPAPTGATTIAAPNRVTSNEVPSTITVNGQTYHDIRVQRITASTVTIFHSTGVATISLEKLPPDLQQEFHYDPKAAAAEIKAEAAAQSVARQARARTERAKRQLVEAGGVVFDIGPLDQALHAAANAEDPIQSSLAAFRKYFIEGKVSQVLTNGLIVATRIGDVFLTRSEHQETAFEGSDIDEMAFPIDRYTYTTVSGASRTIPHYEVAKQIDSASYTGSVKTVEPPP
jgi:hypothetical protein